MAYDPKPTSGATGWNTYLEATIDGLDTGVRNALRPVARRPTRPYNQQTVWGGSSSHPYTTTGGTGAAFNLNDTSTYAVGSQSISITTNGAGANTFVRKLNGTALDLTNRIPRVAFKVDAYATLLDMRLWLGSGGTLANAYQWQLTDGDANRFYTDGEWVWVSLPWSKLATTSGTPTRSALTDVNFQIFDKSSGTPLTVHWGGLATVPDTSAMWPNGVVSLTFDDGYAAHYTQARQYLDKYGFAGTSYCIVDTIGTTNHYTLSQMKDMQRYSGWEFGLHSATIADHDITGGFTSLTSARRAENIRQNREFLLINGFYQPDNFAYPQGIFDAATISDLKPWVNSARTTKSNQLETWPPSDRMKLYQRALSNTDTLAAITAKIDLAKANKEWLILTFHDIVSTGPTSTGTTTAIFQGIVDYLNSTGVAVRTVREVLESSGGAAS